jgi:hypothetical protein
VNASAAETLAPDQRDIGPTITGMIDLRDIPEAHRQRYRAAPVKPNSH